MFKRKMRWLATFFLPSETITHEIKMSFRPTLIIEEEEIEDGVFIPGKQKWDAVYMCFEDIGNLSPLYQYLEGWTPGEDHNPKITIYLSMFHGDGSFLENWVLIEAHPKEINFGDLDHSNSSPIMIEMKWAYKDARYAYRETK